MKRNISIAILLLISTAGFPQKQTFDIATFTPPKNWKKQASNDAIQFSKEDAAKGTYCLMTLYKSMPGKENSKENFDLAWASLIKESVTVSSAPEMQPIAIDNGWEAQSGYAPFESDGSKGIALLVTSSSYQKMINIVILTNTDTYQNEMSAFLESVSLKKITGTTKQVDKPETNTVKPTQTTTVAKKDGFAFTITNFDDGWTSTVQENWVEVTKGSMKALLHFPKEGTIFPADPDTLTRAAWNILVAPHYSTLKNFKTVYISDYERVYLGYGYATDKNSGKEKFVVLFRKGNSGWLEFITPDKNGFIQNFKFDPDAIRYNSDADLMKPLLQIGNYNKFAVAASDFTGAWSSDFTGVQQFYHVYTGNYAGMQINQSNEDFVFGSGNTYSWNLLVVNGMAGNAKAAQVKSSGKFSVLNNWQIQCSSIEGKPKKYNVFFSCIKGARLLHMIDANAPGSGIYTIFGKK